MKALVGHSLTDTEMSKRHSEQLERDRKRRCEDRAQRDREFIEEVKRAQRLSTEGNSTSYLDPCEYEKVSLSDFDCVGLGGAFGAVCVVDLRVPSNPEHKTYAEDTVMLKSEFESGCMADALEETLLNEVFNGEHVPDRERTIHVECTYLNEEYYNGDPCVKHLDIVFKVVAPTLNNLKYYSDNRWMLLTSPPSDGGTFFKLVHALMPILRQSE